MLPTHIEALDSTPKSLFSMIAWRNVGKAFLCRVWRIIQRAYSDLGILPELDYKIGNVDQRNQSSSSLILYTFSLKCFVIAFACQQHPSALIGCSTNTWDAITNWRLHTPIDKNPQVYVCAWSMISVHKLATFLPELSQPIFSHTIKLMFISVEN